MTMNTFDSRALTRTVMIALLVTAATPAMAAGDGSWISPFTDLFDNLGSGLIKLATVIAGVGISAWGLWTSITSDFKWTRLGAVVLGGGVAIYGPDGVNLLLGGK